MCGIAGLVALPAGPPAAEGVARAMAERLAHRGPDERTSWLAPSRRCALGHSRLRVIDLETGGQPMPNEDGSVHAVFNGDIYNFKELRTELEGRGHRFRSRSDTEVLVHGYETWGDALPERVDGMFAFAIWDEPHRRLLLARDRAGKKPRFLSRAGGLLAFACEIKALLEVPAEAGGYEDAFPYYLAYGYVPPPRTFHRGILRVAPASACVLDDDGAFRERRYWRLDFTPRPIPYAQAMRRVRESAREAVRKRLVADVPLGAFLSGGVDSTVVVGVMSELVAEPVLTFALGFADDPVYDETRFARLAAARFGTRHTEFVVEADARARHGRADRRRGRRAVRRLSAAARDGVGRAYAALAHPRGRCRGRCAPSSRLLPEPPTAGCALPLRAERGAPPAGRGRRGRPGGSAGPFPGTARARGRPPAAGPRARAQLRDLSSLPEDLLVKADRCSMAHGLELRSPLLDTALMELAATLPGGHLVHRGVLKRVLREAFAELLPEPIRRRGKMGFGVPLPTWFRTSWRPVLEARVLDPYARLWRWLRRASRWKHSGGSTRKAAPITATPSGRC